MSLDLDSIQEMWKKDSNIDRDNLHEESLKIPSLHAKYFELYNTIFLLRKKAEQQRKNIRHERYEYFSGKAISTRRWTTTALGTTTGSTGAM